MANNEFATNIPSANIRRIDFTSLDYDSNRKIIQEYIKTYYPNDFNDFVASNGFIILMDIISSITDKLSLRGDLHASDAFLSTAVSEEAVENHLNLIGQSIKRQTPSVTDIECTIDNPSLEDVVIPAGFKLNAQGPNNTQITYEIYKGPGDWTGDIVIPAGKRGVVAWGVQGQFGSIFSEVAVGGPNQQYNIIAENILERPVFVDVEYGSVVTRWEVVDDYIQLYGPNDEVVETSFFTTIDGNPSLVVKFGDDINGKAPLAGSVISIRYRVGGGISGRIAAGAIDSSLPVRNGQRTVHVNFRNITASVGGTDKETLEEAKKRAPRTYSLHNSLVTANDYVHFASSFSHPYYGVISKAAVVLENSPNDNIVNLFVLSQGADGLPTTAPIGLKNALETSISSINVLTDQVVIKDGIIKAIDVKARITIDRNADARLVKNEVDIAVKEFFSINNFEMGQPFYQSKLIEKIENVNGVKYVDILNPNRNILPSWKVNSSDVNLVNVNEIITLGSMQLDYYYDNLNSSMV